MIALPYHKSRVYFDESRENIRGVLVSKAHAYITEKSEETIVQTALDRPIGSARLEELLRGKKSMTIITSDHTRPVPSRVTLPIILRRARAANPDLKIKIIVATGTHRAATRDELIEKFGAGIVNKEEIIVHDASDDKSMASLGRLSTGLELVINRAAIETDLLMAEGFIEPHFFAGFSGGRKSVFPGVASLRCVMANHSAERIADPHSRTGVLENNPIHAEATEAAERAGLKFILNVVIDGEKKIIDAYAGHFMEAHAAGCEFVRGLSSVKPAPADIVITTNGGYPMDRNIYQTVKCMTAAEATCKRGGVIIAVSGCADGCGGDGFYRAFTGASSPREVTDRIMKRGRYETEEDQWQAQILARVLEKHSVILVSDAPDKKIIGDMFMLHAENLDSAVSKAKDILNSAAISANIGSYNASITVIPDGVSCIVG